MDSLWWILCGGRERVDSLSSSASDMREIEKEGFEDRDRKVETEKRESLGSNF